MNKFKCRHCNKEVNMVLIIEGEFKGCINCLADANNVDKKVRKFDV